MDFIKQRLALRCLFQPGLKLGLLIHQSLVFVKCLLNLLIDCVLSKNDIALRKIAEVKVPGHAYGAAVRCNLTAGDFEKSGLSLSVSTCHCSPGSAVHREGYVPQEV